MTIVKCTKCGRMIHYAAKCFFCGAADGFSRISDAQVHENAQKAFVAAQKLITQGRFAEGETACTEVMRWSPNSAEAHWLRLLARSGCRSDGELLLSGVSITEMSDYGAACMSGSDAEKEVYLNVGRAHARLRETLSSMVSSKCAAMKKRLEIPQRLSELQQKVAEKRSAMTSAWISLQQYEQQLKQLECGCRMQLHEYRQALSDAQMAAMGIRADIENKDEISENEHFTYKTDLEAISAMSIDVADELEKISAQHPVKNAGAELIAKRDERKMFIEAQLKELKAFEQKTQAFIAEIKAIDAQKEALDAMINSGDHAKLREVLGDANFDRAVQYACAAK